MKSPCEHLAGSANNNTLSSGRGQGEGPRPEDPRLLECRVIVTAFIEDTTKLLNQRFRQLSERLTCVLKDASAAPSSTAAVSNAMTLIAHETAAAFQVNPSVMFSPLRREGIAVPRQTAMFLCRQLTHFSLNMIGDHFGGRDHATVIHACRATQNRIDTDPHFARGLAQLKTRLQEKIDPCSSHRYPQITVTR
jgi:hypothetical protein